MIGDPGGDSPDGRKVKATLHWVSAERSIPAVVRLYDSLFVNANPNDVGEGEDFISYLNPNSLEILTSCRVEPSLSEAILEAITSSKESGTSLLTP